MFGLLYKGHYLDVLKYSHTIHKFNTECVDDYYVRICE